MFVKVRDFKTPSGLMYLCDDAEGAGHADLADTNNCHLGVGVFMLLLGNGVHQLLLQVGCHFVVWYEMSTNQTELMQVHDGCQFVDIKM